MSGQRVGVVGGGISGLAAAYEVHRLLPGATVTVFEGTDRVGGKLRTAALAGHDIDVGAESMLARRPEGLDLVRAAGLGTSLVHPATGAAAVWSRGARWSLPLGTLMGVPSDPESAHGLLTTDEVSRVAAEPAAVHDPVGGDLSVGDFVASRVGPAVVDRLVEPLLAGVYAGHARHLSLQACVPPLWAAAVSGRSIVAAAAAAAQAAARDRSPVFAGYRGGLGALARDLGEVLRADGVEIRTSTVVRELGRTPTGWMLVSGATTSQRHDLDALVLATPAPPTSRLLRTVAPAAADLLAAVEYASMAIVSLAFPRSAAVHVSGSGVLVAPTEPTTVKAATFSSSKWEWVDGLDADVVFLRTSVGRAGDAAVLQHPDRELLSAVLADLDTVLGAVLPAPVDSQLQRWGGALPQYAVGHLGLVSRVEEEVAALPGLELAGAAYRGVGIPACVASGRRAGTAVATHLGAGCGRLRE